MPTTHHENGSGPGDGGLDTASAQGAGGAMPAVPDGLNGPLLGRRGMMAGLAGLFGVIAFSDPVLALTRASGVRLGRHDDFTRVVMDLGDEVHFSVFTLAEPYRVVIDLPEIDWQLGQQGLFGGNGMVKALRYGLFQPGNSRVVLDLARPARVKQAFVLPPAGTTGWRFVLDLEEVAADIFLKTSGPTNRVGTFQLDAKAQEAVYRSPEPAAKPPNSKPVIVIDPGHGGIDPGTIGASGTYEKQITLAAAREFRDLLTRTGHYTVHLTRDRDVFLKLRQRINVARSVGADLFISLHADAHHDTSVKGLSVYTLSENASDSEAAALANEENKVDIIAGVDLSNESAEVTNILIDLAQRESMNLSSRIAEQMIGELRREVTLLRRTHRFAGFAVLKAPDVPSILVEMGYLSNREEERLLRTASYRAKLGDALTRTVDQHFAQIQKASRP